MTEAEMDDKLRVILGKTFGEGVIAERERCAKIAEDGWKGCEEPIYNTAVILDYAEVWRYCCVYIAAKIREGK
jgi:hypothetical protein